MSNIFKVNQPVRVGNFAASPSDVSAGAIYWNTGDLSLYVANGSSYSQLAISTNEFLSNVFRINDNSDPTKKLAFNVAGLSTLTTRTITMPDANVDLGNLTNSNISASAAIAYSKLNLSGSIVNADINASAAIAYSKLNLSNSIVNADINASAAIAYSKLNLSNSIVNADINASAAIDASKIADGSVSNAEFQRINSVTSNVQDQLDAKLSNVLSDGNIFVGSAGNIATSVNPSGDIDVSNAGVFSINAGVIVNADINASAAIAYSKLAALTADRLLVSDGSGFVSVSAVTSTEAGYLSGVTSAIQTQLNAKANDNIVIKKDGSVTYTANQPMGGFKLTGLSAGSGAGDSVRYEQAILRDGSQAFTAAQSMGGFNLTNLADPSSAQDAATKNYVDSLQNGLSWKDSVRVATTAAGTLASDFENGDTVDGITLATNDRILIKNQAAPEENGIYTVNASGAPTRALDMNSWTEVPAAACFVEVGTANADTAWVCTSNSGGTLGTTAITFVMFASTTSLVGGDGIDIAGNIVSVDQDGQGLQFVSNQLALELDGSTLSKSASGLKVADAGITGTQLAASVAGSGLAGGAGSALSVNVDNVGIEISTDTLQLKDNGVTDAKLRDSGALSVIGRSTNSSGDPADISAGTDGFVLRRSGTTLGFGLLVDANIDAAAAIAYSKLNLSNSIVNADINASAAIAYSKLNLSASIVNADIAAGAAIAYNKLAALTASRALQSDGSGFVSVSAVTSTELGYVSGVTSAIQTQLDAKVTGPASATDNAIARFDATTGKLIQNSTSSLSDSGALSIADTFSRGDSGLTNSVEEEYIHGDSLTASTTAVLASLTFDSRNFKSEKIDYSLSNGNIRRVGSLLVVGNNAAGVASTVVSLIDQSTETGDVLVSWAAAVNGNNIELSYTTGAGTFNMNSDIKRFKS